MIMEVVSFEIAEMNINKLRSRQKRGRIGGNGDNR